MPMSVAMACAGRRQCHLPWEHPQKLRERTGSPLKKCAGIFLTRAGGVADVDVRGHGRVLEDADVA